MWKSLDPYSEEEYREINMSFDQSYPEEEGLYHELLGRYQDCPEGDTACYDKSHWTYVNQVIDSLIGLGHHNYSKFKIEPRTNGNGMHFVTYISLRMIMMSLIQRMCHDFKFTDPNYLLYNYSPKTGPSFQNSNTVSQQNNQSQHVEQNLNLTLEQKIDNLDKIINENLSSEQKETISKDLVAFKESPLVWEKAQSLIKGILVFGRDVAVQTIAAVLAILATK